MRGSSPRMTIPGKASSDHIDLAHGLMDAAGALPALREESDGVGADLDHLAALMDVSAAPQQEMAELVARHFAVPVTGRADPDAALILAVRAFMQQYAGSHGPTLDHGRDGAQSLSSVTDFGF